MIGAKQTRGIRNSVSFHTVAWGGWYLELASVDAAKLVAKASTWRRGGGGGVAFCLLLLKISMHSCYNINILMYGNSSREQFGIVYDPSILLSISFRITYSIFDVSKLDEFF